MYEQCISDRKIPVQCSLEYGIDCMVVVIAVATDVIIVKGCRIVVIAVVACVVEYFVLNFVGVFVVASCKYSCNITL